MRLPFASKLQFDRYFLVNRDDRIGALFGGSAIHHLRFTENVDPARFVNMTADQNVRLMTLDKFPDCNAANVGSEADSVELC